jgi:hypothetical protein
VDIGQVFQNPGIVDGGAAISDLDVAPVFDRREHHEQVSRAIALVFAIDPGRAPRLHCDRKAGFGDELLGGLIQANQRSVGIAGPRIDRQHVLHYRYECAARLGRDDPVFAAVRLRSVFLSTRWIVESLAAATMPNSTSLLSNSRELQRAWPSGGLEQARAISRASFSPSKIRGTEGRAGGLRLTEGIPVATISSIASIAMDNESLNPCEIAEASH